MAVAATIAGSRWRDEMPLVLFCHGIWLHGHEYYWRCGRAGQENPTAPAEVAGAVGPKEVVWEQHLDEVYYNPMGGMRGRCRWSYSAGPHGCMDMSTISLDIAVRYGCKAMCAME